MTVTVKPGRKIGTKSRLEALRVQLVAGEVSQQIGRRIRQARLEAGFHRQRDLADRIDELARESGARVPIDNQRISDWERGVHKPNDRYMELLAEALGRDIGWFYGRKDSGTPDLSAIQGVAREEQLDGVVEQFSARVDDVEASLERIENAVEEARRERDEHVNDIKALLREQAELLEMIRAIIGIDPEGQITVQDRLIGMLRDAAAQSGAQSGPSEPS